MEGTRIGSTSGVRWASTHGMATFCNSRVGVADVLGGVTSYLKARVTVAVYQVGVKDARVRSPRFRESVEKRTPAPIVRLCGKDSSVRQRSQSRIWELWKISPLLRHWKREPRPMEPVKVMTQGGKDKGSRRQRCCLYRGSSFLSPCSMLSFTPLPRSYSAVRPQPCSRIPKETST